VSECEGLIRDGHDDEIEALALVAKLMMTGRRLAVD
jgi:hypothetical protein